MGPSISKTSSENDIEEAIKSLPTAFHFYAKTVKDNGINGEVLASLPRDLEQIKASLKNLFDMKDDKHILRFAIEIKRITENVDKVCPSAHLN